MSVEPQPGAVTETVAVTGAVPILQVSRAGAKIEIKQVQEL